MINKLISPILGQDVPNFNQLPPMKRLVLALKTKVTQEELKENIIQRVIPQNKTFNQVFKQYRNINTFRTSLDKSKDYYGQEQRDERKKKAKLATQDGDNLPPDLRFFHKFKAIIRK